MVEEYSNEEFVAVDSRRHRAVVVVYHFEDHEIFHEMHALVMVALSGKTATFGGSVLVEEPHTPGLHDAPTRFLCQHFRAGEHSTWCNPQESRKLRKAFAWYDSNCWRVQ
ncbi:MAG TPA: hypothetical protein VIY29_26515 [Ktedonobacteraceae bacterium]